ncbi:hypothetical protein CC78DRAFT_470946, partial [Lojkania enalia]
IIAIHSLNGHWKGSRTSAINGAVWLADILPEDAKKARIFSYSYNASTHSDKPIYKQSISDHAEDLVAKLLQKVRGKIRS